MRGASRRRFILPIRFDEENATVNAADPSKVAYMYLEGQIPHPRMPVDQYQMMDIGRFDLYVPIGA